MSNSLIRTAVIGCGYLGRFHAQKYQNNPHSELVAVCDLDPDRATAVATELSCQSETDFRRLLPNLDAVSIASTTSSHYAIAKVCLEAGVHVLIEKPITTTTAEADELIELAHQKGCYIQVGHLERYNGVIQAIKPSIKTPRYIASTRLAPFKPRCNDVNVILDLMIHDIDLIQMLVNSPIKSIEATGSCVLTDFIDLANARIEFDNGCIASATASRINHRSQRSIHIAQHSSYIDVDLQNGRYHLNYLENTNTEHAPYIARERHRIPKQDALQDEINDFIHSIKHQTPPTINGEAGRNALKTALSITQAVHKRNQTSPIEMS